jgi:hypothetical protein
MVTISNTGLAEVAGLACGDASGAFTYLALGSGTGAESATDTELGTEIATNGGARVSATVSRVTTTVTNDTAQWNKLFTFTGTLAINECGVLDAATTGILLMRHKFASTKNVENTDTLDLTMKCQMS